MEDNRKGNGIFLGIVGVATLIVAIIGASFAYFSAQASSTENAVNLTAYEFNASLSMTEVYPSNANLIPINPTGTVTGASAPNDTNLAYALNVEKACVDDQGYKVCALYEVTVTNGGAATLTLDGKIVTNVNQAAIRDGAAPFSNLQYRPVTAEEVSGNTVYTIGATATSLATTVGQSVSISPLTVAANSSETAYVLLYLNENENQSAEMGAHFEGQIVYTSTAGSGNELTGKFTVG